MWSPNELLKIEKQRDILSYITLQFFHFKKVPLEHCPLLPELLRFAYSSFISQAIAPLSKTVTTAHVSVRPFPAVPGLRSWTPPASP